MKLQLLEKYWRISATGIGYILFGVGAVVLGVFFNFYHLFPGTKDKKQAFTRRVISLACRYYIDLLQTFNLVVVQSNLSFDRRSGAEPRYHEGSGRLIVANHPTLLDAIYLLSFNCNLCCICKATLLNNPITAQAVQLAGYISNDSDQMIQQAITKLKRGEDLLIFPEGTRTSSDKGIKLKRGAANIAILGGIDILPLVIDCEPLTLQKGVPWYRVPDRLLTVSITQFPVISAAPCASIDSTKPRTIQYRELTAKLQKFFNDYFEFKKQSLSPTNCETLGRRV